MTTFLFCSPHRWNTNKTHLPPLSFFPHIAIKCFVAYVCCMGNGQRAILNELLQKTWVIPSILIHKAPLQRLYKNTDGAQLGKGRASKVWAVLVLGCTNSVLLCFSTLKTWLKVHNHVLFLLLHYNTERWEELRQIQASEYFQNGKDRQKMRQRSTRKDLKGLRSKRTRYQAHQPSAPTLTSSKT